MSNKMNPKQRVFEDPNLMGLILSDSEDVKNLGLTCKSCHAVSIRIGADRTGQIWARMLEGLRDSITWTTTRFDTYYGEQFFAVGPNACLTKNDTGSLVLIDKAGDRWEISPPPKKSLLVTYVLHELDPTFLVVGNIRNGTEMRDISIEVCKVTSRNLTFERIDLSLPGDFEDQVQISSIGDVGCVRLRDTILLAMNIITRCGKQIGVVVEAYLGVWTIRFCESTIGKCFQLMIPCGRKKEPMLLFGDTQLGIRLYRLTTLTTLMEAVDLGEGVVSVHEVFGKWFVLQVSPDENINMSAVDFVHGNVSVRPLSGSPNDAAAVYQRIVDFAVLADEMNRARYFRHHLMDMSNNNLLFFLTDDPNRTLLSRRSEYRSLDQRLAVSLHCYNHVSVEEAFLRDPQMHGHDV